MRGWTRQKSFRAIGAFELLKDRCAETLAAWRQASKKRARPSCSQTHLARGHARGHGRAEADPERYSVWIVDITRDYAVIERVTSSPALRCWLALDVIEVPGARSLGRLFEMLA